jgi:signal transduction histidine kinase
MNQLPRDHTHDCSFSALPDVTDTPNSHADLAALGQALLDRALAVTTMTNGSIWLYEQDNITCLACTPAQSPIKPPQPTVAIRRVIKTGRPEFYGAAGATLPLLARGKPIGALALGNAQEEPSCPLLSVIAGWVAGALDQMRLAGQLEAQQQRLHTITNQQDELLTIISHDLRNPMASIKGYADLLLRRSARLPEDPNRRGLQIISEQVVRMTDLLDQLLDISRINSERLRIDRRTNDLAQLVSQIVAELRENNSQLNIQLEGAEDVLLCALDAARMRQAIGNVLDNAIKYSLEDSPIEVCLEQVGHEAILKIHNDGIGIPASDAERVFEPFFRARNVVNRPGIGIGLFVAQQIVFRHDGRIWFESAHGAGATFYIALPLLAAPRGDEG